MFEITKGQILLKQSKKTGDEYLDKYKLEKIKETSKRIYYKLIVDEIIVGNAWITKKEHKLFRKGMYIYVDPQYRRKKYGTKFYNLLACKITDMDIAWIYLIVDKEDNVAISFINKIINKYEFKFTLGNKIIFQDTLIID